MKATIERAKFLRVLSQVIRACGTKLPATKTILLQSEGSRLTLMATDLELVITASCEATIHEPGAVCMASYPLQQFLEAVDSLEVIVSAEGTKIRLEGGDAFIVVKGFVASDYPPIPRMESEPCEIPGLGWAFGQVLHAAALDNSRPVLTGIYLYPDEGGCDLVAADGFRLAVVSIPVRGGLRQCIIPLKAATFVRDLTDGPVLVRQDSKGMTFSANGLCITCQLIQGFYPNYKQLIPDGGTLLQVHSAGLRRALCIVNAINPSDGLIRLRGSDGKLVVSAKNDEDIAQSMLLATGEIRLAINIRYLLDALNVVSGEVEIRTTSTTTPLLITQGPFQAVIMPMYDRWEEEV